MIDLTVKAFAHNFGQKFELFTCNEYFHTGKIDPLIFGQTLIFPKFFTLQITGRPILMVVWNRHQFHLPQQQQQQ